MASSKIFTTDQTYLRCIHCGYITDLLKERRFQCPQCGDLYDVVHDFKPLKKTFSAFTKLFDKRAAYAFNHGGAVVEHSGVWRFKEWIMPYLPEKYIVSLGEGNVPIVPAGKQLRAWLGGGDVWMILEGMTPTGSFKDFGGTVMMSVAKAAGIKYVGCASTGDTSAMVAAYASAAGIKSVVILPKGKVTAAQLAQPLVHGSTIITVPGDFDDCMRIVRELVSDGRLFPANSLNPTRIEGHQATVFLTAQFFGWQLPDWISLPVGNGSNCSSVGKALRLMQQMGYKGKSSRILACQSEAARPLASSWLQTRASHKTVTIDNWREYYKPMKVGETTATAARIGDPVSREKVMREITNSSGMMQVVPEAMLNEAVAVCGRDGHFVCPQTGIALAGIKLALQQKAIRKKERIVVVSTANGLKFTESAAQGLEKNIHEAVDCKTETVAKLMGV
jgi:threonine synthase